MKSRSRTVRLAALALFACGGLMLYLPDLSIYRAHALTPFPSRSSPLALNSAERFLWVCNPDTNTVSQIDVGGDANVKVREIPVDTEPQSLTLSADNTKVYVACTVAGTVNVISTSTFTVVKKVKVGAEPWGVALTPNGTKLYVANSSSNSVTVINTKNDKVLKTIENVGQQPRALAITNDGDFDDADEKVYVSNFLAQYRFGQIRPGEDLGKVGQVYVIRTSTDAVFTTTLLNPLNDTGFNADGDAINKIAPSGAATVKTGAFPNILVNLSIKGDKVYVPATGSSPNGPHKFNVNAQSLVAAIDIATDADANKTVNLNRGIQFLKQSEDAEGNILKRFATNPYDIVWRHNDDSGYLVSAASDMVYRLEINAQGFPTINAPTGANQPDNIVRFVAGKNPRAMIVNSTDTRGYVWNYVSRDISVVDLDSEEVIDTIESSAQPGDALGREIQRGKELFNTSIGPVSFNPATNELEGQMSDNGWLSCASCHPNGLSDGVVWMFAPGPRFSTPLNATFEKVPLGQIGHQRALNWSANRDEVEDFENNTRGVAGGRGLILLADNKSDPNVFDFDPANAGRSADRDAITTYVRFAVRSPIAPIPDNDPIALKGRKVFEKAGCVACHGGPQWTKSTVEFTPPPPANELLNELGTIQLVGQLDPVGTFNAADKFEVIGNGPNISKQAVGQLGFNSPSLLSVFAFGPYLHNGTVVNLADILNNPAHVGTHPVLAKQKKRDQLVRFMQSIDDSTPPFPK